jgi:transmembrane protein EpsG
MNVFVYTTILVLVLFYIGRKPLDKNTTIETELTKVRDTSFLFFFLGTLLLAYVSGQRYAYGDTVTYIGLFDKAMPMEQCLEVFSIGSEWLFQFYMSFIHTHISTDPRIFLEITSFITIFPLMYFLYNYSGDMKFAFYLFVMAGCWDHSLNGMRQYLATALIVAAFPLLAKRKWYLFLPIVFIVAQIHTSAYIFFILYLISNTEACGKVTKAILIIGVFIVITSPLTGNIIDGFISDTVYGDKYSGNEWSNSINIFRILVSAVPIVLAFINKEVMKDKYKYYNTVFNMALFYTIFTMAGVFSAVYARFNLYFEVFSVLLLVWNINEMVKISKYSWIKNTACICYVLYFIYQMVFTYKLNWHENYLFFCNSWSDTSWI